MLFCVGSDGPPLALRQRNMHAKGRCEVATQGALLSVQA
jgi:hypothetical protein